MIDIKKSIIACAIALASSVSCAEDSKFSISVLKTPEPIKYRMESTMYGGFLWLATSARNSSMSERLSEVLVKSDLRLNEALSKQVERELIDKGFGVTQLAGASINPVKPWSARYSEIQISADAMLHMYFEKVGIQSRPESSTYRPFAHVAYCLYIPSKKNDCAFTDRAYYGEGYTEEDHLVYPANDAYQWADSDDAFRRHENVADSLRTIVSKVAPGIASAVIANIEELKQTKK